MPFSVSQSSFQEPIDGSTTFTITITRSLFQDAENAYFYLLNGDYFSVYGTAASADFVGFETSQTRGLHFENIHFAAGESSVTRSFTIASDAIVEATETFTIRISSATNYNGTSDVVASILDAPVTTLSINNVTVSALFV